MTERYDPAVRRLARLTAAAVARLDLNLRGLRVVTEAATGAYAVTPVMAALAGAEVVALAKDSRHGSVDDVRRQVLRLADELHVCHAITVVDKLDQGRIAAADIVTNSGHLRPLDAGFVGRMKRGAVILLMYETWELRQSDLDLDACRRQGVIVAGTNERHPRIAVFDYLGMAALQGLFSCHIPPPSSRLLLVCDNPFAPYIARTLISAGADLEILARKSLPAELLSYRRDTCLGKEYDAAIVAQPGARPVVGQRGEAIYSAEELGRFDALIQVFGDVDRDCLRGVMFWPPAAPAKGQMGINLAELGPDPVVRLQSGSLKVGQIVCQKGPQAPELRPYGDVYE